MSWHYYYDAHAIHRMSIPERLMSRVVVTPDACWIWEGAQDSGGYGIVTINNHKNLKAHRVSYETFVGPIGDGLHIDHLCRNRACINWRHLEPVTPRENMRRSPVEIPTINENKTHCKRGHAFVEGNIYRSKDCGRRRKACCNAQSREWYANNRASGGVRRAG